MDGFNGVTTAVSLGVKQGDPLPLIPLNLVMDELLEDLHTRLPGIAVDGWDINALVYADDIVLLNEDTHSAQLIISAVERFLTWHQMELIARMCISLIVKLLPYRKNNSTQTLNKESFSDIF